MILLLRGHIRGSFSSQHLYHLVKELTVRYPKIKIYIHTWNVLQTNKSWRKMKNDNTPITEQFIYDYFQDIRSFITRVLIDDDSTIQVIGETKGLISNTKCPLLAWKNMWYGNYQLIRSVKLDMIPDVNTDLIINTRFDVLDNWILLSQLQILNFIQNQYAIFMKQGSILNKSAFIFPKEAVGIDNLYVGTYDVMFQLIDHFYRNLDAILQKYPSIYNQERIVFRENEVLFGTGVSPDTGASHPTFPKPIHAKPHVIRHHSNRYVKTLFPSIMYSAK